MGRSTERYGESHVVARAVIGTRLRVGIHLPMLSGLNKSSGTAKHSLFMTRI